jgi:hypothetical protein
MSIQAADDTHVLHTHSALPTSAKSLSEVELGLNRQQQRADSNVAANAARRQPGVWEKGGLKV